MKSFKYIVYKEGDYYVSQCLNIDISSFGTTSDDAIENLKEAVELYYEDSDNFESYIDIDETMIGETFVNV